MGGNILLDSVWKQQKMAYLDLWISLMCILQYLSFLFFFNAINTWILASGVSVFMLI